MRSCNWGQRHEETKLVVVALHPKNSPNLTTGAAMVVENKGNLVSFWEASNYQGARDETVIAFVDLVGSTEYWFTSPAIATFTVVQIFHNLVLETAWTYGGRPIKGIGDEVMLRFDEPDSSTACRKAVLAAVAIRKKLKEDERVQKAKTEKGLFCKIVIHRVKDAVRIGYRERDLPRLIALEKSTAKAPRGAVKIPEAYARDLLGHHVNLAARINKVVEADQILISHDAFALIQNQIEALRTELSAAALGPIDFSEILTIYGFRGIDKGVQILSIGQFGEVRPPKYPVGSIVLLSLRRGSYASGQLLNQYLTVEETKARRSWAYSIKGYQMKVDEDFAFKVGGLDLVDLERFIGDVFYAEEFRGRTQKTQTIFLRQIRDASHIAVLKCIVEDPFPYLQLWMVKLRELTGGASAEPFEKWLAANIGTANVRLHDYQRTWGEFEACVLLSANSERDLESFRKDCSTRPSVPMDYSLSKLFSVIPPSQTGG